MFVQYNFMMKFSFSFISLKNGKMEEKPYQTRYKFSFFVNELEKIKEGFFYHWNKETCSNMYLKRLLYIFSYINNLYGNAILKKLQFDIFQVSRVYLRKYIKNIDFPSLNAGKSFSFSYFFIHPLLQIKRSLKEAPFNFFSNLFEYQTKFLSIFCHFYQREKGTDFQ